MAACVRDILTTMCASLNPAAAGDLQAVLQFKFKGSDPCNGYLSIDKGSCSFSEGEHASPNLTVMCKSETWQAIAGGQRDAMQAFFLGELQVKGDMGLAMRLQSLFKAI